MDTITEPERVNLFDAVMASRDGTRNLAATGEVDWLKALDEPTPAEAA